MFTLTLILCTIAALVGALVLRALVARYEPVRSAGLGLFSVELRRRALVIEHPSGMGGKPFRQPTEGRVRVFRIASLPVWRQGCSVDLPLQVVGMIGTLTARDFDAEFDDRFRLASFDQVMPAWMKRQHSGKGGSAGPGAKRMLR